MGWSDAAGRHPEETVLLAAGQLRLHAGQKYNERHGLLDPKDSVPVGIGFPYVRVGRGRQPLEHRASSLHVGARRGPREVHQRSCAMPREGFDVVLNGTELGSGSIRIHRKDIQSQGVRRTRVQRRRSPARIRLPVRSAGIRRTTARRDSARPRSPMVDGSSPARPASAT